MNGPVTVDADRPTGPRTSKGERTRAKLLESAKAVFEEHGFAAARISDIAERAGLSYGAFYHYFPSKEETFREVAAVHEGRLGEAVAAAIDVAGETPAATLASRLEAANRRYLAEYRQEARLMRVIEQVSRFDGALNEARLERHQRHVRGLAHAVARLQAKGLVDPGLEPEVAAQIVMSMVTRFAEAWFVEGRISCDFPDGVAQLNRLCLNALGLSSPADG